MDFFTIGVKAGAVPRYFRINEGNTDYATLPAIDLQGDWEIGFKLITSTSSGGTAVCVNINTADASEYISLAVSFGKMKVVSAGLTPGQSTVSVNDNVLHDIKVTLVGSLFSVFIDGNLDYTVTHAAPSKLGRTYGANVYAQSTTTAGAKTDLLDGVISDLYFNDAGTLERTYPINESSGVSLLDQVSGQTGTIVNGSDDDRGLFDKLGNGNWQGSGLTVPPWASVNQILVVA